MHNEQELKTVALRDGVTLCGYRDEYIFQRIEQTGDYYEREILEKWIQPRRNGIRVIYDIGANIGNHSVYFAAHTDAQAVYALEPFADNYQLLLKNIAGNALSNVHPIQAAASDFSGGVRMRISRENNNGTARIVENGEDGIPAETVRLDDLQLPDPDFVKIDVEGHELRVLKGMQGILERCKPDLWIEVGCENATAVYETLEAAGYGAADYSLEQDGNVLFVQKSRGGVPCRGDVFRALLTEAASRKHTADLLRRKESQFTYEQKKANELQSKLEKKASSLIYEQERVRTGQERISALEKQCETEQRIRKEQEAKILEQEQQIQKTEEELIRLTGRLTEIGKQLEEMTGRFTEVNERMRMYEKSRLFRLMLWIWSVSTKTRFYGRKWIHQAAAWLYRKLMPYPGALRLCSRINGRLKIVRNPGQVLAQTATPTAKAVPRDTAIRTASQLQVAAVVDEFTYNSFRFECRLLPVEPDNWEQIFEENRIDLFFCESAWSGVDSQRRPWKGRVYASCNFPKENRGALLDILQYCRRHRIPTVFWNKEDPTHYEDKVHNFVDTAIQFDHIFTTDAACVDRYRKEYHHPSVHCLPFATQPRLFNPIETRERTEEVIFAGSWYRQHEERSREMEKILDQILAQGLPLKIYDRHFGSTDPNHFFPERFQKYLHPALPHEQMDDAYKASRYALNINTVVDSDTMFARRVFELMSCNTLVLSNYSRGMERLFGEDVLFVDGEKPISMENTEQKREDCLYHVLRHHTYENRWRRVLQCIGYPYREDSHAVCFFYRVRNLNGAAAAAGHFNTLALPEKSAVFLVSMDADGAQLRGILEQYQDRWIRVISERYCRTYQDALQLTSPYFVFADEQLDADFPEKALLHDAYLAGEAGIMQGSCRYRFVQHEGFQNVLCPARLFDQAKQDFYTGKPYTHRVYVI